MEDLEPRRPIHRWREMSDQQQSGLTVAGFDLVSKCSRSEETSDRAAADISGRTALCVVGLGVTINTSWGFDSGDCLGSQEQLLTSLLDASEQGLQDGQRRASAYGHDMRLKSNN